MTNAELNARAASIAGLWFCDFGQIWYRGGEHAYKAGEWNPCESVEQAFELAERVIDMFPDFHLTIGKGKIWNEVVIDEADKGEVSRVDGEKNIALAIVRACVAAAEKATS